MAVFGFLSAEIQVRLITEDLTPDAGAIGTYISHYGT